MGSIDRLQQDGLPRDLPHFVKNTVTVAIIEGPIPVTVKIIISNN